MRVRISLVPPNLNLSGAWRGERVPVSMIRELARTVIVSTSPRRPPPTMPTPVIAMDQVRGFTSFSFEEARRFSRRQPE